MLLMVWSLKTVIYWTFLTPQAPGPPFFLAPLASSAKSALW